MDFTKYRERFSLSINDIMFGQIDYYSVTKAPYAQSASGSTQQDNEMVYTIKIHRRLDPEKKREILDFYNSSVFDIKITRINRTISYYLCALDSIVEDIGTDNLIYQTLYFTTTTRA